MGQKLLALMLLVCGSTALAQNDTPEVSKAPLAAMQALKAMEGLWVMVPEVTFDGGKSWQANPAERAEVTFRQKGMMLAEVPLDPDQPGFHMESYITYDQYRRVYRVAAVDDVWGIMDLYEAQLEAGRLVGTNLKSGTFFPVEGGGWRGFRIAYELTSPTRRMIIDKTEDGGDTFEPYFRITYTKQ